MRYIELALLPLAIIYPFVIVSVPQYSSVQQPEVNRLAVTNVITGLEHVVKQNILKLSNMSMTIGCPFYLQHQPSDIGISEMQKAVKQLPKTYSIPGILKAPTTPLP